VGSALLNDDETAAKVQKTNQNQHATTRSKSLGSNGSQRSGVSGATDVGTNSVAHFSDIASQMEGQVKKAGLPTASPQKERQ
jgi:hypothetical protein